MPENLLARVPSGKHAKKDGSFISWQIRTAKYVIQKKMSNPKLETLNSKQTQMFKSLNPKPIVEKSKLTFEFYFLDFLRI